MESQPIIVILAVFAPLFNTNGGTVPPGEVAITLLLLGLQWWAMVGKRFVQHGADDRKVQPFHLGGLVLALAIIIAITIEYMSNFLAFFLMIALVIWCWKRGIDWARTGLDDDHIISTFRIGFCVLLVGLIVGILLLNIASPFVLVMLAQALPLFFISGLIGLSFTRLGLIRRENARHASTGSDHTRSWLTILTLVWGIIVVAAIALETFSFQTILALAPFFWNALGSVVNWILSAIYFLLAPLLAWLFNGGKAQIPAYPSPGQGKGQGHRPPPHISPISPEAILIGRIVLLLIVLVVVVLVVRAILKRWHPDQEEDEEEEERESLSMQEILKMRREERRKKKKEAVALLEPLDPDSARARYRELLQTVAGSNEKLARRSNETPAEYETRIAVRVEHASSGTEPAPADATILDELTRAYVKERYGGKRIEAAQRNYLRLWVPRLLKRFKQLTGNTK
jgi:hypothetical protein